MVRCAICYAQLDNLLARCPNGCKAIIRAHPNAPKTILDEIREQYREACLLREGLQLITGARDPVQAAVPPYSVELFG